MNLRNFKYKGAVIGAVWGVPLVSLFLASIAHTIQYWLGIACCPESNMFLIGRRWEFKVFGFPYFATRIIFKTLGLLKGETSAWGAVAFLILGTPPSMFIGALIGYILIDRKLLNKLLKR